MKTKINLSIDRAQELANMLHTNIFEGVNAADEIVFRCNCMTIKQASEKVKFAFGDGAYFIKVVQVPVKKVSQDDRNHEAQQLIYEVLEHISAGRMNIDLMKQKLIQAAKNLPCKLHSGLSKYN
jgi:hypothetical protein